MCCKLQLHLNRDHLEHRIAIDVDWDVVNVWQL